MTDDQPTSRSETPAVVLFVVGALSAGAALDTLPSRGLPQAVVLTLAVLATISGAVAIIKRNRTRVAAWTIAAVLIAGAIVITSVDKYSETTSGRPIWQWPSYVPPNPGFPVRYISRTEQVGKGTPTYGRVKTVDNSYRSGFTLNADNQSGHVTFAVPPGATTFKASVGATEVPCHQYVVLVRLDGILRERIPVGDDEEYSACQKHEVIYGGDQDVAWDVRGLKTVTIALLAEDHPVFGIIFGDARFE
ncbi:MAG: hypothetical protein IT193_16705 [Propionibacteriaceae bacterium]|nr:hypothetical protein [Propionibacteriaceae bacterium]